MVPACRYADSKEIIVFVDDLPGLVRMMLLHFGANAEVTIPDGAQVRKFGEVSDKPISDVSQAVRDALQDPQGYPALTSVTIPEDRVAIVLESGLTQAAEIVAGVVHELLMAKVEPENIVVIRSKSDAAHSQASPLRALSEPLRESIECIVHDPADREMLSYLGAASDDSPIYVNRQIADADVVIPIGTVKHTNTLGDLGVHGIIVPHFADEATSERFLQPRSSLSSREKRKRREESREITWMLGTRMTVQVILGNGDFIQHVLAGDADVVETRGHAICEQLWHVSVPQRASLVVAGITGGKQQQTWENLARTVRTAMQLVESEGAIAICSELNARPGIALRKLVGADSLDTAARVLKNDKSTDALAALELVTALQNVKVYLLSKMDEQLVADLGLGYISHPDEVTRLANRHSSCISIENAQRVIVTIAGD
jgi:nickel-dependent lactate racemase